MTKVVLTGDWHLGAGTLQVDEIINIAKKYWKKKPVILMGDMVDFGLDRGMQWEAAMQPQDQLVNFKEAVKHLSVKAYCLGNHEERVFRQAGLNVYEPILGKPSHRLKVDDITFCFTHGRSIARDIWQEHKRILWYWDADVLAIGHNHYLAKLTVPKERVFVQDGRVQFKMRIATLLRTGTLAKRLRYAKRLLCSPRIRGWVEYDTKQKIARLYMIDDENNVTEI